MATQGHTDAPTPLEPRPRPLVLDAEGVGRLIDAGRSKVLELDARGELPAPVILGRTRRWVRAEVEAWLLHGAPSRSTWERLWPRVRKELLQR